MSLVTDTRTWLNDKIVIQKLNNPIGYLIVLGMSLFVAGMMSFLGWKVSMLFLGLIVGFPLLALCFIDQYIGTLVIMCTSIFVLAVGKYIDLPFGIALDALLFSMFFGLIVTQVKERNLSFIQNPISLLIILWVVYNLVQVLNPVAPSKMAWLYTVRSMAGLIFLFFIASYSLNSLAKIKSALKVFIGLAFLSALYGMKQEYIGFTSGEMIWLSSDVERYKLIFQWSRLRVFSFFSDPTNLGICMAYTGVVCFILATGPFKIYQRIILVIAGASMFFTMALAGARTPFVLIPFGFLVYLMLTLKKEAFIAVGVFFVLGAGLMMKSTNNAVIFRIQSAFDTKTSGDTMDVRFKNQKMIQPYIHSHPFGAGLGTTGGWGKRFSPDFFLSNFAHDSGYVRIAVELGWVGLIIYGIFLLMVLRTGVYYYLRVKNEQIKIMYLALTVMMFMLTLANYPQEAIVQLPNSIFFYVVLAMIVKLKDYDENFMEIEDKFSN